MDADSLRQSLLPLLTPNAHPLTAFRIDQILALHRIVAQLEEALASHPVLIEDPKRGPRLHPVLDALTKNRERLRRAINDLERTLPKPARTRKEDKGQQPRADHEYETVEAAGSDASIGQCEDQPAAMQTTHAAPAQLAASTSPSPPRGRGRGEGQHHTNGPAHLPTTIGPDPRVRPAPGKSAPPLHANRETAEAAGSEAPDGQHDAKLTAASSPSPPRGRGRGEGQHHTNGPAHLPTTIGPDPRVRPAPGKSAPPLHANRAGFLRHAASQLVP